MDYKIIYIGSPEGIDLKTYVPEVKDEFCLEIEIVVQFGKGEENAETYSFDVGSPKGISSYYTNLLKLLDKKLSQPKITFVEPTIVMEKYSYTKMLKFVRDYLYEIKGRNQIEQSLILSRRLYWQFLAENPKSHRPIFDRLKGKR
jgi:hypothetical protein